MSEKAISVHVLHPTKRPWCYSDERMDPNYYAIESCNTVHQVRHCAPIVDVRVAYMRKFAVLSNREPMVTANYSPVFYSYIWGAT